MIDTMDTGKIGKELIRIGGMQCSFCVESISRGIRQIEGVVDVSVNFSHEEALVTYDVEKAAPEMFHRFLMDMGFKVRDSKRLKALEEEKEYLRAFRTRLFCAVFFGVVALFFMGLMWAGIRHPLFPWGMFGLALVVVFGVGWEILKMALTSIRRKILNQHVLMEFGAFGGLLGGIMGFFVQPWPMSDFFGASIFITIYHILSGYVSALVRIRSSEAIVKLMELQPAVATVLIEGTERLVPIEEVRAGDYVVVRPGERVPIDGVIVKGETYMDFSVVNGESMPRSCGVGDEVLGGALNQFGFVTIEATKAGDDGFLFQVARAIEEARALKPGVLQLVEKVLKYFVPWVLITAILTFTFWTAGAWFLFGEIQLLKAIYATMAVLVMGYPCALGMATPLAMIRGGGKAAEKGILMRAGEAFQVFKDVTVFCFDKTGTLTEGVPKVVGVEVGIDKKLEEVVAVAAAIENASEHPIGKAIVHYAEEKKIDFSGIEVHRFEAITGSGVKASTNRGSVVIGSRRFLENHGVEFGDLAAENFGRVPATRAFIAIESVHVGTFVLQDTIRADAKQTIIKLDELGIGSLMLTGDNSQVGKAIAESLGIDVKAEMLPQEKAEVIRNLQKQGETVAMVGDGINDAPALKQANVGISFASGSDISIDSADIVLIGNRLEALLDAYMIGRNSYSKTVQNVGLAFLFNGIGVSLAVTGLIHPVMAMIAMALSVSAVLANSYIAPTRLKKET